MANAFSNPITYSETAAGQIALHALVGSRLPLPAVRSYITKGARRTYHDAEGVTEFYPSRYAPEDTLLGHLRFALRYEPCDLAILHDALITLGSTRIAQWVQVEPTSAYSRRAWYLYETLVGEILDLPPARAGNYVDALDPMRHYTAAPLNSPRHRVRDNLLGSAEFCPTVRRTPKLESMAAAGLDQEARRLTAEYSPEILARAVGFLYTKETRSSFALEGETPSPNREERFFQALRSVAEFDPTNKAHLLAMQGQIVEARYAAHDYREFQNFVGETTRRYGEYVHFIGPRPEDVPSLMAGWMAMTKRLLTSAVDPVVASAVCAFGFVFIHPFEDGNGRLHRFLIHSLLSRKGFAPPGLVFPVSAAILRQRHVYDRVLEAFSKPTLGATDWVFMPDQSIVVRNDTHDLYRFFDATAQAEFLYDRIAETIQVDFIEELEFLTLYDASFAAVRAIVEMPDRRAALLVRLLLQNNGRLSHNKRGQFAELTDDELRQMEEAVVSLLRER